MAQPTTPPPVKLLCGMIAAGPTLMDEAQAALERLWGPADLVSDLMPFDFTHYYDAQMGCPLWRRFTAFERLAAPEALVGAKLASNRIEDELAGLHPGGPPRPINLDPGYLETSKLVLASMKNFSHRLYLGSGVYGELTLLVRGGRWEAMAWTFPDFASGRYHGYLEQVRRRLREQLRELGP
jgi:hypothetical protein